MRICDLCHGRELVALYYVAIWPGEGTPGVKDKATGWDLCEECRSHVKAEIQAVLNTKRGKAAEATPTATKKTRKPKFEGAT